MKKALLLIFVSVSTFLFGTEYTVNTIPYPKTKIRSSAFFIVSIF
jgi:hypothetical protein